MAITYQVLGEAGRDNALFVWIDTGQSIERLLFDCGQGCIDALPFADVQATDQLFFSHLHMDHVGGFDAFFRAMFDRAVKPNQIWGPPGTGRILQHRFQGYYWNLLDNLSATWRVSDVHTESVRTRGFELAEAFAVAHDLGNEPLKEVLCEGEAYQVRAMTMEHRGPSLAYLVREKPRENIDPQRLAALGIPPGPWLRELKQATDLSRRMELAGRQWTVGQWRDALMVTTPGDSVAYLTDFLLDEPAMERLSDFLAGCQTVVCESQYHHLDLSLAQKNYHLTSVLAAQLARRVQPQRLVLFHLSDRYQRPVWLQMLREAQAIFPATCYPGHWHLA